jgi:hypothetical protein
MHTGAVDAEDRFGHEGSDQVVLCSDGLDCVFQGQDVIGCAQGIRKAEIDFMLAQSNFVVAYFDLQAHGIQGGHQLSSHLRSFIVG